MIATPLSNPVVMKPVAAYSGGPVRLPARRRLRRLGELPRRFRRAARRSRACLDMRPCIVSTLHLVYCQRVSQESERAEIFRSAMAE